ncbi:uncharacterized protein LOC131381786 [Hylobates moloch]|uniref:uncharacterized protein LOC131381786 n=1 Tax=Hylobates moloch TaxID=81572 RepID=UPI0026766D98|nr:uncharacterized protein LOC131381786 [Hylobates moloch]
MAGPAPGGCASICLVRVPRGDWEALPQQLRGAQALRAHATLPVQHRRPHAPPARRGSADRWQEDADDLTRRAMVRRPLWPFLEAAKVRPAHAGERQTRVNGKDRAAQPYHARLRRLLPVTPRPSTTPAPRRRGQNGDGVLNAAQGILGAGQLYHVKIVPASSSPSTIIVSFPRPPQLCLLHSLQNWSNLNLILLIPSVVFCLCLRKKDDTQECAQCRWEQEETALCGDYKSVTFNYYMSKNKKDENTKG